MTKEDIIQMAREAGVEFTYDPTETPPKTFVECWMEELEKFAALIRADERSSWPAEMEAMERQVNILTDALAKAKADERDACEALREHEDVLAPVGNSAWGEAFQEGWGQGTAAYRDAIRARSNT
jgi:hypothetical protein